ncbi:MAG: hypothetical protein ABWZ52_03800 [Acidimicrobiales bacterium]
MSGDGFTVDYVTLASLAQQLANLRGEFEEGDDALQPLMGTLSNDHLRDKVHDFAENWSDKREGIVERLNQVAGFARAAADAYREIDAAYAAGFDDACAPGGG